MKTKLILILILMLQVVILNSCNFQNSKQDDPRTTSFDEGWRFIRDNPSGAEAPAFDDAGWRQINLPP